MACAGKLRPLSAERVTSVDVAEQCGVSQSTVSLVFSGKAPGRVSARTEAAVRAAAEELGYRPNAAARALKTGAARTVVLVVPDVTNPFFGGLLRGAQTAARAAGYAVALIDTNNDRDWGAASAEALHAGPADGLLLLEIDPPGRGGLRARRDDRVRGARPPLRPLRRRQRRRGRGPPSAGAGPRAHRARRLDLRPADVPAAAARGRPARRPGAPRVALRRSRSTGRRPRRSSCCAAPPETTALFCDDDVIAAGAYLAARELGLRIPEDLSVVGFDGLELGRILDPPLTTVVADGREMGRVAFELLLAQFAGRKPRSRVLAVELLVRGSTAPPR